MKHFWLVFLALFLCTLAWTQEKEHKYILGGQLGINSYFNTGEVQGNEVLSFRLSPLLAYQWKEDWLIGVKAGYGYRSQKATGSQVRVHSHSLSFTPLARKKVFQVEKFSAFAEIALPFTYNILVRENTNGYIQNKSYQIGAYAAPSFEYQFSPTWSMNVIWGIIGYTLKKDIGVARTIHNIMLNANLSSLNWGVNYHF